VILVARSTSTLRAAIDDIVGDSTERHRLSEYLADVSDASQVTAMEAWVREQFGRIDVLVNCVGQSDRGTAGKLSLEVLEQLWRTNVVTAVNCTTTFLPLLQANKGAIINIGSLASKFGAKWMGGYVLVKHALAGWTQQLRLELAPQVHVMLICPGPIHSPGDKSSVSRYADREGDLPPEALKPGGGAKLNGLDSAWLASHVYRALQRRQGELIVPARARCLLALLALWPRLGEAILRRSSG
jgi:short-subunit dehydrogenase